MQSSAVRICCENTLSYWKHQKSCTYYKGYKNTSYLRLLNSKQSDFKLFFMKHFTKSLKALECLENEILAGSKNVVRLLKEAGHMDQKSVKHV